MASAADALQFAIPRLIDLDQLDIENEIAKDRPLACIGQALRNPEPPLLAFDHQLHAFSPTRDHAVELERRGLPIHYGAVE